jgi:hypothetical protein
MITAAVLLVTLAAATLLGLIIYRWRRRKRFSIAWGLGSVLLAVLLFAVSGTTYVYYRVSYPPLDDASLVQHDDLELRFGLAAASDAVGTATSSKSLEDRIIFRHRPQAGLNSDFQVSVHIEPVTATGPLRVELDAPKSWQVRTSDVCPSPQNPGEPGNLVPACGAVIDHAFEVSWTITPTVPATSLSAIILPPELRPDILYGTDWSAFPYMGGQALTWWGDDRSGQRVIRERSPYGSFGRSYNGEVAPQAPVRLDAGAPKLLYGGYDIDLSRGHLGAQTTVLRTLGVSEETYTWVAFIGAILSSALGTGWLVQFLSWAAKKISGHSTPESVD